MKRIIIRAIVIPVMMLSLLVLGSAEASYADNDYGLSNPTTKDIVQSDAYELDQNNYSEQPDLETKWDCVWFGSYPQSDATGEYFEPIKWRVLHVDGDDAFLLADKILDTHAYHSTSGDTTWEECSLRSWLNDEFYNTAFTSEEQAAIRTTTVATEDNPLYYNAYGGNDTQDKVYILSLFEASNPEYGFPNDRDTYYNYGIYSRTRWAYVTEYAKATGSYASSKSVGNGTGMYWVRTPGNQQRNACMIETAGYLSAGGWGVYHTEVSVRPVLHIDLSSDSWSYAGTVTSEGEVDEAAPLIPPSEEIVLDELNIELQQGYSAIPMQGMDCFAYRKNLKVADSEGVPLRSFAIWTWGVWDDATNQYLSAGNHRDSGDTFDADKKYRAELQVVIDNSNEYKQYSFADGAIIRIGDLKFTLHYASPNETTFFGYFYSDPITPRYIEVEGETITEANMNDVLGDKDEGSTVTYDNTNNVLRLNNAHLTNDSENIMLSCIYAQDMELDIELNGKNSITFNSKVDTNTYQDYADRDAILISRGDLNIYGSGSLDFFLEADFDKNGDPFVTEGILCTTLKLKDASLSFTVRNCKYGKAILAYKNIYLSGDANVTIEESGEDDLGIGFLGIEAAQNYYAEGNSKVIINTSSKGTAGMYATYGAVLYENSMMAISSPEAFYMEEGWEESDVVLDSNHKYGTALVSKEADGSNRYVMTDRVLDGWYTYVQVPAPVYTPASEPTQTEAGNKEHYYDPVFDKYYSDATGNVEISKDDVIIEPENCDGGHTFSDWVTTAEPTCVDKGSKSRECSVCHLVETEEIPALGHQFGDWTTVKAATEIAEGLQSRTCPVCKASETRPIAVLAPTLPAVKISKPAAAKKSLTAKWKKVSKKNLKKIKKIEIQCSTDKYFKNDLKTKYASAKKTSYKVKGLKKGKKYYVRIRAYTSSGGVVHVSKWTKAKTVKVK